MPMIGGPPAGVNGTIAASAWSAVSKTTTHVSVPAPSFIHIPITSSGFLAT